MVDYFITSLKTIKNYSGLKLLLALTVVAWIYLFVCEKDKAKRIIFVYMPVVVGLVFICPLTMVLFIKMGLDTQIYYRLLWMIPFGIITIYAFVKFFGGSVRTRIFGLVISTGLIMVTGVYAYSNVSFTKTENIYGIPSQTKEVVDYLRTLNPDEVITVLPSSDLITTIRQYDSSILMPYGRDMFAPNSPFHNGVYETYEKPELLNVANLLEETRQYPIEYIIIYKARLLEDDPEEAGLIFVADVDDHLIYRDPAATEIIDAYRAYY